MTEKILVTVTEAADMLSLSRRQVYELANAGALGNKHYVGARNFRLRLEDVRAYADSRPAERTTA